jgi:UDP-GlcNAc:undecaprenyl-phosphate GlcNAc-1-phosphate transferase
LIDFIEIIEILSLCIVTSIFIIFIRKNAKILGLLDMPNQRSMHSEAIPKGAGIAFYMALSLSLVFFHYDFMREIIWVYLAISLIFLLGVLDDLYTVLPKVKFLFIIFSVYLLSFNHLLIYDIGTFFSISISLTHFALPFTIFVLAGFTNAINLIDGLDALAGTISLLLFSVFFYIGYSHEDIFMQIFSLSFISILLAFLIFNYYPASIFMGDSGSLLLGFMLSILAIKSLAYIPAISVLFIGAIPIFDTLIVILRRKAHGHALCTADACHIHHIVKYYFKGNVHKSVFFLLLLQMIYIIIGLQFNKGLEQGFILILFLVNILIFYKVLDKIIKEENIHC